jgi:PEGA domain
MRKTILFWLLLSVLPAGGCATLLRGPRQTLTFHTDPTEAQVIVDGKAYTSPVSVSLARKYKHDVEIKKWGYRTLKFSIDPQWDGVSLVGNIILPGGSAGLVIDHVVGSDEMFYALARIKLMPATQPDEPPVVLDDFKGHLMTETEVAADVQAERRDRAQFFRGEP